MNEEQINKYAEEIVRLLVATNCVQINDRRRAVGIVKQALEGESLREQSSLALFGQKKE